MKHIHLPNDFRIFVFGSNRLGIHGAGAARYAAKELNAKYGIGEGPTGWAYALPTCSTPGCPLTLEQIAEHVATFLNYAENHPERQFFVSAVGCGIAGFGESDIAPLFCNAPANCDLPPYWR